MYRTRSQQNDYTAFMAGSFGGITSVLIGYPFDTVKVRVQVQNGSHQFYKGPVDCIQKTVANEGFRALYQGVWFPLLSVGVTRAINLGIADTTATFFKRNRILENQDKFKFFLCGGLGGSAVSLLTTPMDNVRTKMQVHRKVDKTSRNTLICLQTMISQQGPSSLYKALGVTATRNFIGCGSFFATYQCLKRSILETKNKQKLNCWEQCITGAISGAAFWIFTFPLDSVKTRIQADSVISPKYKGTIDCLVQTVATRGPKSLFNGLTPTLIKSVPMNVGFWTVYEAVSSLSLSNRF